MRAVHGRLATDKPERFRLPCTPRRLVGAVGPEGPLTVWRAIGELSKTEQTCLMCQDKICEDKSTMAAALARQAPVEKRT